MHNVTCDEGHSHIPERVDASLPTLGDGEMIPGHAFSFLPVIIKKCLTDSYAQISSSLRHRGARCMTL